jgi:hypothetical protein
MCPFEYLLPSTLSVSIFQGCYRAYHSEKTTTPLWQSTTTSTTTTTTVPFIFFHDTTSTSAPTNQSDPFRNDTQPAAPQVQPYRLLADTVDVSEAPLVVVPSRDYYAEAFDEQDALKTGLSQWLVERMTTTNGHDNNNNNNDDDKNNITNSSLQPSMQAPEIHIMFWEIVS